MRREGGNYIGFFFLKKKDCSAKSDEKNTLFSKLYKIKKFVHKTGGKMGLYGGKKNLLVPLPERKKKFLSG